MNDEHDPYAELVKERSPLLYCDVCMYYPIEPVHGHFMCPSCHSVTKCCEGMPVEVKAAPPVKQRAKAKVGAEPKPSTKLAAKAAKKPAAAKGAG